MRTTSLVALAFFSLLSLTSCEEDISERIQITTDRISYAIADTAHVRILNNGDVSLAFVAWHGDLAFAIEKQIGNAWIETGMVNGFVGDDSNPEIELGPDEVFEYDYPLDEDLFSPGGFYRLRVRCYINSRGDYRYSNSFRMY
jgi:hypothetical protein